MRKVVFLLCSFFVWNLWAVPVPNTLTEKRETNTMLIDIRYPQGFQNKKIDTTIRNFIAQTKSSAENAWKQSASTEGAGKNALVIDYKITFFNPKVVSLLFNISTNFKGAAHPINHVATFNFVNGKRIVLPKLLSTVYLPTIAQYCRDILIKKAVADKNWITTGTEPRIKNYKNWYFTENGLAIVFDTYQVAPYAFGPQTVMIPKVMTITIIKPAIEQAVWESR